MLGEKWGGLTFPGSDEEGGAHPQIMQMRHRFDAKQAGLAANVSPVVKGRDSLGEIPGEGGWGKERGSLGNKWGFAGSSPSVIHYHIST